MLQQFNDNGKPFLSMFYLLVLLKDIGMSSAVDGCGYVDTGTDDLFDAYTNPCMWILIRTIGIAAKAREDRPSPYITYNWT